jgi:hypothetical protein
MCESLKVEIRDLRIKLKIVEDLIATHNYDSQISNKSNDIGSPSDEELIMDDQLRLFESDRDDLEERINKLLELEQYQTLCNHEFITDLIDLNPDRSDTIVYCKNCMYVN